MDEESGTIEECAICYEPVCNDVDVLKPCGHYIHKHCFLMTESNLCPICRRVVENPIPNVIILSYNEEYISLKHYGYLIIILCFTYLLLNIINEYKYVYNNIKVG